MFRFCACVCGTTIAKPFEIDTLLNQIAALLASSAERDNSRGGLSCDA
jgi:hypothetical protein